MFVVFFSKVKPNFFLTVFCDPSTHFVVAFNISFLTYLRFVLFVLFCFYWFCLYLCVNISQSALPNNLSLNFLGLLRDICLFRITFKILHKPQPTFVAFSL